MNSPQLSQLIAAMPVFSIRASACGDIMTEGKTPGTLGKTCISYLDTWIKENLYGIRKNISSKYFEKGNACENDAIGFVAETLDYFGGLEKNTERIKGDFMVGECDVIAPDCIIDIKNSWDAFTFPLFSPQTDIDKAYWWQGQVYMELFGKDAFKLCYCLMDMPEFMLESEVSKAAYKEGIEDITRDFYDKIKAQYTYSHLPSELRLKVFEFKKDPDAIEKIKARVIQCREYIAKTLTALPAPKTIILESYKPQNNDESKRLCATKIPDGTIRKGCIRPRERL